DIRQFLDSQAFKHGGAITHFADATCPCSAREFGVHVLASQHCISLECEECRGIIYLGPSVVTAKDHGAEVCNCFCSVDCFEVCAGVVRCLGTQPRRLFFAAPCTLCGLMAEYADWAMPKGARKPAWRVKA